MLRRICDRCGYPDGEEGSVKRCVLSVYFGDSQQFPWQGDLCEACRSQIVAELNSKPPIRKEKDQGLRC